MRTLCIIQARMGSTRLPNKVLMKVGDTTLLGYELERVKKAKKIDKIVVATTVGANDDASVQFCNSVGVDSFRGSEADVLDRYHQCVLQYPGYEAVVRVTGDCPLIDPVVIDKVITFFEGGEYDYASNIQKETFPDGMDIEVFKREVLEDAAKNAKLQSEHEHVTLYIRNKDEFKKGNLEAENDFGHFRLTVDRMEDFEVVKFLIENSALEDGYLHYISVLTRHPEIMAKNMSIMRNEGLLKSLKEDKIV